MEEEAAADEGRIAATVQALTDAGHGECVVPLAVFGYRFTELLDGVRP